MQNYKLCAMFENNHIFVLKVSKYRKQNSPILQKTNKILYIFLP